MNPLIFDSGPTLAMVTRGLGDGRADRRRDHRGPPQRTTSAEKDAIKAARIPDGWRRDHGVAYLGVAERPGTL